MRVSKEPEIRKQEIMDAALKVFARKGYEAATMKDIASEAAVVPGLCYHYFQNKQQLYEEAVKQYAVECSRAFIAVFCQTDLSLDECLDRLEKAVADQAGEYKYKDFFDREGNELFHRQLELYMSGEIFPHVRNYLECLAGRGKIDCSHLDLLARFLWEGQMAVFRDERIPVGERVMFIREILSKLLDRY